MSLENHEIRIVVTGGGSGGHTVPALVMIKHWKAKKIGRIFYMGSKAGIERHVVDTYVDDYFPINTGKLRRYITLENIADFFKFIWGIVEAWFVLLKLKPQTVFSTGGYVALPVVLAAYFLRIKIVIHEQTTHVGLANRLSSFFADKICISFQSSEQYFSPKKVVFTGYPLREEFYTQIPKLATFQNQSFPPEKKILLILGGGNGSILLNKFVKEHWMTLTEQFSVVLQCGRIGEKDFNFSHPGLWVFNFLEKEMPSLLNTADYVIARSGAGTVCELIHLGKACLFVPLQIAQKNEQWFNAQEAKKLIKAEVIKEEEWKNLKVDDVIKILINLKPAKAVLQTPAHLKIDELVLAASKE